MQLFKARDTLKASAIIAPAQTGLSCGCCGEFLEPEECAHPEEHPEGMVATLAARHGTICTTCADLHTPCSYCAKPMKAGEEWADREDAKLCSRSCEDAWLWEVTE